MSHKILIVDDENYLQEYIADKFCREIRRNEYEFFYADTLEKAWQEIQNHQLDLILLDIVLKEKENGFALLEKLKQNNIASKVIVVSANGTPENYRKAIQEKVVDFIAKPFHPKDFVETIKNHVHPQASSVPLTEKRKANATPTMSNTSVRVGTVIRLIETLPPAKKYQLVAQLIDRFNWKQAPESGNTPLESITSNFEERLKREDEERVSQGKISLLLLARGTIEEKPYTTVKGTTKIHYVLRWRDERKKLRSRSLTPNDLADPLVRQILESKLGKTIQLSP
jgi:DNA-binding response OmpR family regulator